MPEIDVAADEERKTLEEEKILINSGKRKQEDTSFFQNQSLLALTQPEKKHPRVM